MDGSGLSNRVEQTLSEDAAAVRTNRFFLPDSIKFGQHPGTQAAPKPKHADIPGALSRARAQLVEALAAQETARTGIARNALLGGAGGEAHVAAARARVDYLTDLIAGLEMLAEREKVQQ